LQPTTTQNRIISKRTGRNQKENDNKKELRLQPNILNHDQTFVAKHIRTQKDTEEAVYKASLPKASLCFKESTPHAPFS
jgi:hypothetical protein